MSKSKRNYILERAKTSGVAFKFTDADLDSTLDKFIAMLQKQKEEAEKAGYSNLIIGVETNEYGCNFAVTGYRMETDQELTHRVNRYEAEKKMKKEWKTKRELSERKELERLTKKYGADTL